MYIKEILSDLMALCKTGLESLLKDAFILSSSFKSQKAQLASHANRNRSLPCLSRFSVVATGVELGTLNQRNTPQADG